MKQFCLDLLTLLMSLCFVLVLGALIEGALPASLLVATLACLGCGIYVSYRTSTQILLAKRKAKQRHILAARAKQRRQATQQRTASMPRASVPVANQSLSVA